MEKRDGGCCAPSDPRSITLVGEIGRHARDLCARKGEHTVMIDARQGAHIEQLLDRAGWRGWLLHPVGPVPHAGLERLLVVATEVSSAPYRGPQALQDRLTHLCDEAFRRRRDAGGNVFGRPPEAANLLRIEGYRVIAASELELLVRPTWYWYMLGTNFGPGLASGLGLDLTAAERRNPGICGTASWATSSRPTSWR